MPSDAPTPAGLLICCLLLPLLLALALDAVRLLLFDTLGTGAKG